MSTRLPEFIRFGRETCGDLEQAEHREWWLADGFGGYAAGSVALSLTRRYHGLLFDADSGSLSRRLLFAKAEAVLVDGERRHPLTANHWLSGAVEPAGHRNIESFWLEGSTPAWRFEIGDILVEQRIWFEPGQRVLCLGWTLVRPPDRPIGLDVALLCNDRDHHGETDGGALPGLGSALQDGGLALTRDGVPRLFFSSPQGRFRTDATWYRGFLLTAERARGLPDHEDHLCIGHLHIDLVPGRITGLSASREPLPAGWDPGASLKRRHYHDGNRIQHALLCTPGYAAAPDWVRQLLIDSDRFLVAQAHPQPPSPTSLSYWNDRSELCDGAAVIAGYPWFGAWGRDTFIALPGLTLATGRFVVARRILERWATTVRQGLLPNFLPEDGTSPAYNSADAPLWYIEAWHAYHQHTGDLPAVLHVLPVLEDIVGHYARGTAFGIGMDPHDGLMRAGGPATQLTWMDAQVGGEPVTPRWGKPVEINALWYNALRVLQGFASLAGADADPYARLAERTRSGFARFVRPDGGLHDVLDGDDDGDPTPRPNQILAVSLPHSALDPAAQQGVVRQVAQRLLTSYGLRTLAPASPHYRPRYVGGVAERDAGYHQGPAWAWLLGHFALAEYRTSGDALQALSRLDPIRDHLLDAGLGSVSELFDGDSPHCPRGAPCQAWSVAVTLHAWHRLTCAHQKQCRAANDPVRRIATAT